MSGPSILCVDDYETSLGGWCLYLQGEGFSVTTARTAQEGLQLFAVSPVDLVLLDYDLPDSNGNEADRKDRKSTRLNSSHANISYAVFCLKKKNVTGKIPRCLSALLISVIP